MSFTQQKEYKKNMHYYITIRRPNGTLCVYETNALYSWVIDKHNNDPITDENLWYQTDRIRDKNKWLTLYKNIEISNITEFTQQILIDYLNNPNKIELLEKARAFVGIETFYSLGLIHKHMSTKKTRSYTSSRQNQWMLRVSSNGTNCNRTTCSNSQVVVFAYNNKYTRLQETDGAGCISLSGYDTDPMNYKCTMKSCFIDLLLETCNKIHFNIQNIIIPTEENIEK